MTTRTPSGSGQPAALGTNIEFAWRCHTTEENWTSKVDTKASIFFTVNGAGLAGLIALQNQAGSILRQAGLSALVLLGIGLCAVAAVVAGGAIFPLLKSKDGHRDNSKDGHRDTSKGGHRDTSRDGHRNVIYFGHLYRRDPAEVAEQLRTLTEEEQLAQLSRNLVAMARANETKHRLLQVALLTAGLGYALVAVGALV